MASTFFLPKKDNAEKYYRKGTMCVVQHENLRRSL